MAVNIETSSISISSGYTAIVVLACTNYLSIEARDIKQINARITMTSYERLGVGTNRK